MIISVSNGRNKKSLKVKRMGWSRMEHVKDVKDKVRQDEAASACSLESSKNKDAD